MEDGTPLTMRSRRWRGVFVYVVDVAIDDARSSLVVGVYGWSRYVCVCVCVCVLLECAGEQPIPRGVTFSKAFSKLKAQSSNVSFRWNMAKETFVLRALSFETAFEMSPQVGLAVLVSIENGITKLRWRRKTAQDNTLVNNLVPTITKLSTICQTEIANQERMKSLRVLC